MTDMLFELADVPPAPIVSPAARELTEQGWEITTSVYEVPMDDWYDYRYEPCHAKIFAIFTNYTTRYFAQVHVYSDWDDESEVCEYFACVCVFSKNGKLGTNPINQTSTTRSLTQAILLAHDVAAGLVWQYEIRKQSEAA